VLRATAEGVTLALRLQPGARRAGIGGIYGEGATAQLRIALRAPANEGRANAALTEFLAETFSVPKSAVQIVSGETSRSKLVLLRSVTMAQASALLARSVDR
jgi:uncharacterized protein